MSFSQQQLGQMIGNSNDLDGWYTALSSVLPNYDITTPQREAAFIAQCSHESQNFTRLHENLNYSWSSLRRVFPSHFSTDEEAQQYDRQPEKIANRVYANRMGNGDENSGDGYRYCGRGLIQLTGRNNYNAFADSVNMSLDDVPAFLETFTGAVQSACWFWIKENLNSYADSQDIATMTRRINGGTLGLEDRLNKYNNFLSILS
jgi:putative chitinase